MTGGLAGGIATDSGYVSKAVLREFVSSRILPLVGFPAVDLADKMPVPAIALAIILIAPPDPLMLGWLGLFAVIVPIRLTLACVAIKIAPPPPFGILS